MNAGAKRPPEVRRFRSREVVVGFVPHEVKAPFLLRSAALLIDYIIVVALPVIGLVLSRLTGNDGARLLNSELNTVGWLVAILLFGSNIVLLPMFTGQSVGKMLTGLRIVRIDGYPAAPSTLAFRQIAGYLLTASTGGIGFLASVFSGTGRALHDYVSGTVVIYADKRRRL